MFMLVVRIEKESAPQAYSLFFLVSADRIMPRGIESCLLFISELERHLIGKFRRDTSRTLN